MDPRLLSEREVLRIHSDLIERYGGSPEIRDIGLLRSAIGVVEGGIGDEYFHTDLFEMAAAYLFHITQNHPFVDGNKRTGAGAAWLFLYVNGIRFAASEKEFEPIVMKVAQGKTNKLEIAEEFRRRAQPR